MWANISEIPKDIIWKRYLAYIFIFQGKCNSLLTALQIRSEKYKGKGNETSPETNHEFLNEINAS